MGKKPLQLIIIGGGSSIREGVKKDLWEKLKNKFVIGINYSYHFFPNPTIQCFLDAKVYDDNIEEMKKLPLLITKTLKKEREGNILTIPTTTKYSRDLKTGVYKGSLTGIYCLSLGIYLLDEGEIFLLGYDYGKSGMEKDKPLTHFYQGKINHRGIGKNGYYNAKGRVDKDFGVYKNETKVKIYNVSLKSKISYFPKISYNEFFNKLDNKQYNQKELRDFIQTKINKRS